MIRLASIGYSSTKFCTIFMPDGAGLLGVELHAEDVVLLERRSVWQRVVGSGRGRFGDRHVVAVREVHMRLRRNALEQSAGLVKSSVFQPMCGTRASAGKRSTVPSKIPSPATSVASQLR